MKGEHVRYLMYFLVLLSDVLVLGALIIVWIVMPVWFSVVITLLAFKAWKESGGFMAWRPEWIITFEKLAIRNKWWKDCRHDTL